MHRLTPLLFVTTTACWKVSGTGPTSMEGRILDADGEPVVGVPVETVESAWVTGEDGRFKVHYKEPSQVVRFTVAGVEYRRRYQPSDDGEADVVLRLPETAERVLGCEFATPCDATLTWDLGPAFQGIVRGRCDRDEPSILEAVPPGMPDRITCRTDTTAPDAPADARLGARALVVTPPKVEITVQLGTVGDVAPSRCEVAVDGVPAERTGDGRYRGQAFGYTTLEAVCDGIPASPQYLYVRDPVSWSMPWTADVPTLDLQPHTPWVTALTIAKHDGPGAGWVVDVPVDDEGVAHLPPLDEGIYNLGAGLAQHRVKSMEPATPGKLPANVAVWREVPEPLWLTDRAEGMGALRVAGRLPAGRMKIQWIEGDP